MPELTRVPESASARRVRAPIRAALGAVAGSLVAIVVLIAALLKFADLPGFAASLWTWKLIPEAWAAPLALVVPTLELAAAGAFLVGVRRRLAWAALLLLLFGFTAAFAAHAIFVGVPECRCFGELLRLRTKAAEASFAMGRNAVLISLLVVGGWLDGTAGSVWRWAKLRPKRGPGAMSTRVRAFTMIEMTVSIALVALLIALLLPALGRTRDDAQALASRSNLRQHAANFSAYAGDHADVWPYFTDPEADWTIVRTSGPTFKVRYFMAHFSWHAAMGDSFYGGNFVHPTLHAPWQQPRPTTTYYYADCFIARPEFWNPVTRSGPAQWKPTRADEVLFPSDKGLILENGEDEDGDGRRPAREDDGVLRFAAVDGSTASRAAFSAPYPTGTGQFRGSWLQSGWPVLHTIDGVRGRD